MTQSSRECVKVAVRVRPLLQQSSNEKDTDDILDVDQNNGSLSIESAASAKGDEGPAQKSYFTFDYAFPPDCTQQEVYEQAASEVVQAVLDGYNGTIFAYGQTGSGKTYTMYGKGSGSVRGIIPRAVSQIFDFVAKNDSALQVNIRASYVQLYHDQLLDLLTPHYTSGRVSVSGRGTNSCFVSGSVSGRGTNSGSGFVSGSVSGSAGSVAGHGTNSGSAGSGAAGSIGARSGFVSGSVVGRGTNSGSGYGSAAAGSVGAGRGAAPEKREYHDLPKIILREDSNHSFQMENNTVVLIESVEDLNRLIATGKKNRKVRRTQMNDESTRAHTILSIWVETVGKTTQVGRLNLVDLAGSEKCSKAGTEGEALKEGSSINYALLILGNCISALTAKKPMAVIPYRDSPLTKRLKDSLGGNAKTLMIATLSPSSFNASESMNTLRYAQKAKMIRNNAVVNMDPKDALLQKYQQELAELQTRIVQQSAFIEGSGSVEAIGIVSQKSCIDLEIIQCEMERMKKERIEMKKLMQEEEERIRQEMEKQNEMVHTIEQLSKTRPQPNSDLIRKKERLRKTKEKIDQKKDMIHKEYDDILETWKKLSMVVKKHIPKDELKKIYENAEYDEETMQWRMKQKKRARTADIIRTDIEVTLPERPTTPQ